MTEKNQLRILVAPLDWGLGHTARCVPIIHHLRRLGHTPIVACNDDQAYFIDQAIPGIEKTNLPGYGIRYSGNDRLNFLAIALQAPRIPAAVRREHEWLKNNYQQLRIDGVISDNRYGLQYGKMPSAIITHQLMIPTGLGNTVNRIVQRYHYGLLKRFDEVWVPDVPQQPRLAGNLSTTVAMPRHTHYIGLLSQFAVQPRPAPGGKHLLVLLSGPEPQRTKVAGLLWKQCLNYPGHVVFIAGSRHAAAPNDIPAHITYIATAAGSELAALIANSSFVICRSGYSSLMDIIWFRKSALLIPTPGQREQEYLAQYLATLKWFDTARQKNAVVPEKQAKQATVQYPFTDQHFERFKRYLEIWLAKI